MEKTSSGKNVFAQVFSVFKSKRFRNIFYLLLIVFASLSMLCIDKYNNVRTKYFSFLDNNFIADFMAVLGIERYEITSKAWILFGLIATVMTIIILGNIIAPGFIGKKVKANPNLFSTERKTRIWYTFLFYGVLVLIAGAIIAIAYFAGLFNLYNRNKNDTAPFISLLTMLGFFLAFVSAIFIALIIIIFIIRLIVLLCKGKPHNTQEEQKPEEPIPAPVQAESVKEELISGEPEPIKEEPTSTTVEAAEPIKEPEVKSVTKPKEPIIVINTFPESNKEDFISKKSIQKSFAGKMAQATKEQKAYYNELKNYMLSFKRVNSRVSWNYDSFNIGRDKVVKIAFRGQTMCIFFALNPKDYVNTKYYPRDMGDKRKFADTPMMVKVKSQRGVKFVKELMDEVCKNLTPKKNFVAEKYDFPYMSDSKLVQKGLAKEITVTVFAPQE